LLEKNIPFTGGVKMKFFLGEVHKIGSEYYAENYTQSMQKGVRRTNWLFGCLWI